MPELVEYYSKVPGKYIIPNSEAIGRARTTHFFEDGENNFTPIGENEFDLKFSQDLFKLEVNRFTQYMGGIDFLDAKSRFYSKLIFNERTQKNERTYSYLNGWLTLNHPPIKKLELALDHYTELFSPKNPRPKESAYFSEKFQTDLDEQTGTELTFGNRLHALFNDQSIKEKVRIVKAADHYVFGSVMATICDASSEELVQALIDKAQEGIPVSVMMERFYMSGFFRRCANRLRRGGVDLLLINEKWKPHSLLTFLHAKFWISDNEVAIIGGQNIAKFNNESTGFNQMDRDTDLLVQGPGVTDLTSEFIEFWKSHARKNNHSLASFEAELKQAKEVQRIAHTRGTAFYEEQLSNPLTRMKGVCRMMLQSSHDRNYSYGDVLKSYAANSKESMIFTGPELEYSPRHSIPFFDEVRTAATQRGVKVELVGNGVDGGSGEITTEMRLQMEEASEDRRKLRYDFFHKLLNIEPQHVARGHRKNLRELSITPGIRTWTYFNYIHAKQAYFDRIVTSISSFNFDTASFDRNIEAGAICMDENLSAEMEPQLTLDLVNSVPVISASEIDNESVSESDN